MCSRVTFRKNYQNQLWMVHVLRLHWKQVGCCKVTLPTYYLFGRYTITTAVICQLHGKQVSYLRVRLHGKTEVTIDGIIWATLAASEHSQHETLSKQKSTSTNVNPK